MFDCERAVKLAQRNILTKADLLSLQNEVIKKVRISSDGLNIKTLELWPELLFLTEADQRPVKCFFKTFYISAEPVAEKARYQKKESR